MNSFVVVFVPCSETRPDIEAAPRKHTDAAEFAGQSAAVSTQAIEDAEQLPLWRWFISAT